MSGEGVAEQVGVDFDVQALDARPVGDAQLHRPGAQAGAVAPHEQGGLAPSGDTRALPDPPVQGFERLASYGDDALLPALAHHANRTVRLEAVDVQSHEFRQSQSR